MDIYKSLLEGNRQWVQEKLDEDSEFFTRLAQGQSPQVLWIGCSDSRVPANEITRTQPGDIFVHRNIANMVVHSDMNMLSVLDYSVNILKVRHVIVCGHYGCGGVKAAMGEEQHGLVDNWLRHIKDVRGMYAQQLTDIKDPEARVNRLVELNVIEQVQHVAKTSIIQNAWSNGKKLAVHGLVYDLKTGILNDLDITMTDKSELPKFYLVDSAVN